MTLDIFKRWTSQAIDCYRRGCRCQGCILSDLESKCSMKLTVRELVRRYGAPPEYEGYIDGLTKRQNQVIEAILDGCDTKPEIAEQMGVHECVVQQSLTDMYPLFREMGFKSSKGRNRLPEFVEFIRGAYG